MWEGKWALVTGAGSGIGRATARLLGARGAKLILVDIEEPRLLALEEELRARGTTVLSRLVDVSSRSDMSALAEWVDSEVPALDLLVNNAGILLTGGFDAVDLDGWERIVGVNLMGTVYGTKLFVPKMVARGKGHVVNVASASGLVGFPLLTAYSTTKFAVVGLTLSMRGELVGTGVTVSAVCPGLVNTNIMERPEVSLREQASIRALLGKHGMTPEKVAEAILRSAEKDEGVVPVGVQALALSSVGSWLRNVTPGLIARLGTK